MGFSFWGKAFVFSSLLAVLIAIYLLGFGEEGFDQAYPGGSGWLSEITGEEKHEPFENWFKNNGGIANKVRLGQIPNMGRGVIATAPISKKDEIFRVPLDIIMCRQTVLKDPAFSALSSFDDTDLVAAYLLREWAKREESFWFPYIEVLPREIPVPVLFSDEELAELQDQPLAAEISRRRDRMHSHFTSKILPALEPLLFGLEAGAGSWEMYVWADAIIGSRALTIRGKKFLIPYAGMFNFAPADTIRTADAGAAFLEFHRLGKDDFRVFADRPAASGEQVVEDYGDVNNRIYLEHHAFIPDTNMFACSPVLLPAFRGENEKLQRDLLRQFNIFSSGHVCLVNNTSILSLPFKINTFLQVYEMSTEELDNCKPVISGSRNPATVQKCIGQKGQPSLSTLEVLFRSVAKTLSGFSTTIAQDMELLEHRTRNTMLAVRYRLKNKEVLSLLLEKWTEELRPLRLVDNSEALTPPLSTERRLQETAKEEAPAVEPKKKIKKRRKKPKVNIAEQLKNDADVFNKWFLENNEGGKCKIETRFVDNELRLGAYATEKITPEELYLAVSTHIVMDSAKALRSEALAEVFLTLNARFPQGDPYHQLLFWLIHEYFGLKEESFYYPYLKLMPTPAEMQTLPLFYTKEDIQALQGSETLPDIEFYQQQVRQKYNGVSQHVFSQFGVFDPNVFNFETYRWASSILNTRSIWWNSERHLVPMLDMINCVEGPDPSRVHRTDLEVTGQHAVTHAPWAFDADEQVFENYGQPNHIYYLYHGFTLEKNTHDCVKIAIGRRGDFSKSVPESNVLEQMRQLNLPKPPHEFCVAPKVAKGIAARYLDLQMELEGVGAYPIWSSALKTLPEGFVEYLRLVKGEKEDVDAVTMWRHVLDVVQKKLRRYSTSLAVDEAFLAKPRREKSSLHSQRLLSMTLFRASEKRILVDLEKVLSELLPSDD